MGFLNNVRSHFKNNEEEEFERAFREGTWPEEDDGFALLSNTGSFLPATYEVDPLADASLPGNAMHASQAQPAAAEQGAAPEAAQAPAQPVPAAPVAPAAQQAACPAAPMSPEITIEEPAIQATDSVVRAAATSVYAAPQAQSPFQVIDGSLRPRGAASQGAPAQVAEMPAAPQAPAAPAQGGPRYDGADEGVHVVARPAGERAPRREAPRGEAKPFADRLRERVAAAEASGQMGALSAAAPQPASADRPHPARRAENASEADLDAELEERRRSRRANQERIEREAREARGAGDAREVIAARGEQAPRREEAAGAPAGPRPSFDAAPRDVPPASSVPVAPVLVPMAPTVVRPRTYDDVRDIANGVLGEHRPTVLVLKGCTGDLARRVLDFSFGMCCASGATMREFGNHVYVVLPRGTTLSEQDLASLRRQGLVR